MPPINGDKDMEVKIATIAVMLDGLKTSFLEHLGRQDNTLDRIETNLIRLNGRTGKSEEEIRNLSRLATESIVKADVDRMEQIKIHAAVAKIRGQIWRWSITLGVLGAVGLGLIFALDHHVIKFTPQDYHAGK